MPYKRHADQVAAQRRHYEANRNAYRTCSLKARRAREAAVNKAKDGPCKDCGIKYPPYVMQFDHVGPGKVANIAKMIRDAGIERVLAEVAKCELVCANCHAERTQSRLKKHPS